MVIAERYRLVRPIGTGGMATIWEATHLALNRSVAVKFVDIVGRHTASVRDRFLREARVAAAVRHRNVVDIIDFGTTEEGRPYMAMELLVGRTLADVMNRGPVLTVAASVRVVARMLSGLAAVHDAGIVHRDLKPENVFLVEDADGTYPKLLDFGVSRAVDPGGELESVLPTHENAIVGTPQYMSPEQARGLKGLDHRSDIWSAGVILYELMTGEMPFDAEAVGDVIIQIATEDPIPFSTLRPDLAGPLDDVIGRAMKKNPAERFQTARDMRAALLAAAAQTAAELQGPDVGRSAADTEHAPPDLGAPTVAADELLSAVGDAYEPGDSGLLDFSEQLHVLGHEPISGLRLVPPGAVTQGATGPHDSLGELHDIAPRPRGRGLAIAIGATTILAIGAVGIAYYTRARPSSNEIRATELPHAPAVAEGHVSEPPVSPVAITLRGVPEGAQVTVDGRPVSGDSLTLPRDDAAHAIVVRRDDQSWEATHVASADGTYDVTFPEVADVNPVAAPTVEAPVATRPQGRRRPGRGRAGARCETGSATGLMRNPGF
jgi:serine/threonine-protein kinase